MKGTFRNAIAVVACIAALLAPVSVGEALAAPGHVGAYPHSTTKRVHRWGPYWVAAPPAKLAHPLPVRINPLALAAVTACVLVLASWGLWQTRNRCSSCGYCPVFCRCDELARH